MLCQLAGGPRTMNMNWPGGFEKEIEPLYDGYMLETELFAFLENTADASFAVGDSDEICFWNRAAEAMFGYPSDEVLGKTCSAVLHGIGVLGPTCVMNAVLRCNVARK